MTQKQAQAILAAFGMTMRKTNAGDYRVNFRVGGTESSAYYTDCIDDAVDTGKAMAAATRVDDTPRALIPQELDAVKAWAQYCGRTWKAQLHTAWYTGNYNGFPAYGWLQGIRNSPSLGPRWLDSFKLPK